MFYFFFFCFFLDLIILPACYLLDIILHPLISTFTNSNQRKRDPRPHPSPTGTQIPRPNYCNLQRALSNHRSNKALQSPHFRPDQNTMASTRMVRLSFHRNPNRRSNIRGLQNQIHNHGIQQKHHLHQTRPRTRRNPTNTPPPGL